MTLTTSDIEAADEFTVSETLKNDITEQDRPDMYYKERREISNAVTHLAICDTLTRTVYISPAALANIESILKHVSGEKKMG